MQGASKRRIVAAALAVAAFGVTTATAQAGTVTDDFTGGIPVNTTAGAGGVELASAFNEGFDGTALPAGWPAPTLWSPDGTTTVGGGAVSIQRSLVNTGVPAGPGSSLRFTATFGPQASQHIGFGVDFNLTARWAMFSTGTDTSTPMLSARTLDGAVNETTPLPGVALDVPHVFRIDWTATGVVYYVDNNEVARDAAPTTAPMTAMASDFYESSALSVDSMTLRTVSTGTYTSKALDAGDARVAGVTFTPTSTGQVTYQTRSGSTATPGPGWSGWGAPAATKPARYVQYRATLTAGAVDPRVTAASVNFRIDSVAPAVSIGAIKVTAGTAQVPFSSDDAKATYACSLDGGAFAACTSPARFSGLSAGRHTVSVRARDGVGNQRTATGSFVVAGTQASPDHSAPRVTVPRSMKVSSKGKVRLRLRCPADESRCSITVKLRYKGATVAHKTIKVDGGKARGVSLRVKRSVRRLVEDRGELKVTATVSARDDSGNRWTKRKPVTLEQA
jgi:hypothetical protein